MALEHSEKAKRFYDSQVWKRTRLVYMDNVDWLCERCKDTAYILHHKEWIDSNNVDDLDVILNHDNLEAVCIQCHNEEHFKTNHSTQEGLTFDMYGNLVRHG